MSLAWGADLTRLATTYDVDLIIAAATADELQQQPLPAQLAALLERSSADVALLSGRGARPGRGAVLVGFGGSEHDWAAVELGAWMAQSAGKPLRLLALRRAASAAPADATRLLAAASIAVQGAVGIDAEPLLVEPGPAPLIAAAQAAHALVLGLSPAWRHRGLGAVRRALAAELQAPLLLVHRGPRPGGLAPAASKTRFTWSLG